MQAGLRQCPRAVGVWEFQGSGPDSSLLAGDSASDLDLDPRPHGLVSYVLEEACGRVTEGRGRWRVLLAVEGFSVFQGFSVLVSGV